MIISNTALRSRLSSSLANAGSEDWLMDVEPSHHFTLVTCHKNEIVVVVMHLL